MRVTNDSSEDSKKNEFKPHLKKYWKIPPENNGAFVAAMEDVLEVYHLPYNPKVPVVCMDESNKQLVGEVCQPIRCQSGEPLRIDREYTRNGVADIFVAVEPLIGKTFVKITERRTMIDWAHFIKDVLDIQYPDAEKVRLIMDNLNTHSMGSFYEAFTPEEAIRLSKRLEIHYTPKHGSWLNIAEIELSALTSQCLDRRIPDFETMRREVSAWQNDRNNRRIKIDWQFSKPMPGLSLGDFIQSFLTVQGASG